MPIDGGVRHKLEAGTVLVARYKGAEHRAEVVAGEEGKVGYRLTDGREFKSPSAAASALMGGIACNGWRFWSLLSNELEAAAEGTRPGKASKTRRAKAGLEPAEAIEAAPGEAIAE